MTRVIAAAAVTGVLLVACGVTNAGPAMLHITRTPGAFILPALDREITDRPTVDRLAGDIQSLPAMPAGAVYFCPIDFGTTYLLAFTREGERPWTASVQVMGCQMVTLGDGRVRLANGATSLFLDLRTALGLSDAELVPKPCDVVAQAATCYRQSGN